VPNVISINVRYIQNNQRYSVMHDRLGTCDRKYSSIGQNPQCIAVSPDITNEKVIHLCHMSTCSTYMRQRHYYRF